MSALHQWLTTAPHPTRPAHAHGADQGQVGWRLHIVDPNIGPVYGNKNKSPALCGLVPKHGWALDMFIDMPCARCQAKADKLGIKMEKI